MFWLEQRWTVLFLPAITSICTPQSLAFFCMCCDHMEELGFMRQSVIKMDLDCRGTDLTCGLKALFSGFDLLIDWTLLELYKHLFYFFYFFFGVTHLNRKSLNVIWKKQIKTKNLTWTCLHLSCKCDRYWKWTYFSCWCFMKWIYCFLSHR